MSENIRLNVALLRKKVPNLTVAAKSVGLRPATVSNLSTGKIPIAQAKVKTLVSLAELANCTLDELILRDSNFKLIETGIKAIDLFAPILSGGTVGLVARQGVGQLVLLAEIFHRMRKEGFKTGFCLLDEETRGVNDVINEADFYSADIDEIRNNVEQLRIENDIFLGVDRKRYLSNEFQDFFEQYDGDPNSRVTFLIVDTIGDSVDEELPYGPLDTLWHFDMSLVTREMYPAIDPLKSTSIVLEEPSLEEQHMKVQLRAKKVLRRYKELTYMVERWGIDRLSKEDQVMYERGKRLEMYFTQPFFVAEAFTKRSGESVSLEQVIVDVEKILNGEADKLTLEDLKYFGALQ